MVQAANSTRLNHSPLLRRVGRPSLRCVLVSGEMSPRAVVVSGIARENLPEMTLAEDNHMVQTLAADRADDALRIRVLPGRPRSCADFLDLERVCLSAESLAIDRVAIADEVSRHFLKAAGLQELSSGPAGCRMLRNIEMHNPSSLVPQDHEHE